MEFTEDEYLVASVLVSFRSYFREEESIPPLSWGRRRKRSVLELPRRVQAKLSVSEEENALVPARASKNGGSPTPAPVNSPQTPLEYPQTSPGCSGEKQPSPLNKRKPPVTKSGKKLRTTEGLKSTLDDHIQTNLFLKTEINRLNQLQADLLRANSLLKNRLQEINSINSTGVEHFCNIDPQQIQQQPLGLDSHHQLPMMVPCNNPRHRLFVTKEAAALARQRRKLICREKKNKVVVFNYINMRM